jgi:hypothetical protein
MNASTDTDYRLDGFHLARGAIDPLCIDGIREELLSIGSLNDAVPAFDSIDAMWNHYKRSDRSKASLLYNAFKYLPSVHRLALSDRMAGQLAKVCGMRKPALVDINCRIDSSGEDKYLFGWHQDYWFSVCSTQAAVVWIPIMGLDRSVGGLELISNRHTGGQILKSRPGEHYNSYADAVVLGEELPAYEKIAVDDMATGDALFFSFNLLHRSLPVMNEERSRFTVQLRFADFEDTQFIQEKYRPGTVSSVKVDYLKKANT